MIKNAIIVGSLFFSITALAQQVELTVVSVEQGALGCWYNYQVTNKIDKTLTRFSIKGRVEDRSGQLISNFDFYVNNLRPTKTISDRDIVRSVNCSEIKKLVVEAVDTCESGNENYNLDSCLRILTFPSGRLKIEK